MLKLTFLSYFFPIQLVWCYLPFSSYIFKQALIKKCYQINRSAFYDCEKCICQTPKVRSMVMKIVDLAPLVSVMHLLTSFMEYLSICVLALRPQKSWTILSPCLDFLGKLYRDCALWTTPNLSLSQRDCSTNSWGSGLRWNCL